MIITLVTVAHVFIAIVLVLLILLQQGKGADTGAVFGGGGNTVFGATGADNLLTRVTTVFAICFMATSVTLAIESKNSVTTTESVFDSIPDAPVTAPVTAPATTPVADTPATEQSTDASTPAAKVEDTAEASTQEAIETVEEAAAIADPSLETEQAEAPAEAAETTTEEAK